MDDLEKSDSSDNDEQANSSKIPIFVMDQHHRAYKMIRRCIDKKLLPEIGNTIIHLDAHIDELIPKDLQLRMKIESELSVSKLFGDFGIENWLKTAVADKCINHVIWVKPPWARQVKDCHVDLEHGATLDVKTLGKSVFSNVEEDYEGFQSIFLKYLKPDDSYILDIEYNFFSSDNPFTSDYSDAKDYYLYLKNTFELEIPTTETENSGKFIEKRSEQLLQLKKIFDHLEQNRSLPSEAAYSPELYKRVSKLRKYLLEFYSEDKIEWKKIFNSGVVSNDLQLPVHHTSREDIKKMLTCLEKMLDLLPSPPSVVTIAIMYEYDCNTPPDTVEFIGDILNDFFRTRYENTDFEYEDF